MILFRISNGSIKIYFDFFNIRLYKIMSFVSNIIDQFPGVTYNKLDLYENQSSIYISLAKNNNKNL